MLQDAQDLRANDWIPHQGHEDTLKTIDQVGVLIFENIKLDVIVQECCIKDFHCSDSS